MKYNLKDRYQIYAYIMSIAGKHVSYMKTAEDLEEKRFMLQDFKDMQKVAELILKGKKKEASNYFDKLDTDVRELLWPAVKVYFKGLYG